MKIIFTDCSTVVQNNDIDLSIFDDMGEVEYYDLTAPSELYDRIKDADVVICNKTIIDSATMARCKRLKYIGLLATGYNNIDMEYTRKHHICVCNAGQYSTNAVAQHCFSMILSLYSSLPYYSTFTSDGGWIHSKTFAPFTSSQHELYDKTIGIVGCGSIGLKMAHIATAFGMHVLAYVRHPRTIEGVEIVSFDELLENSDIISVHCPLDESTKKMFNSSAFAHMKSNAIFINSARGGIVDEYALREALENNRIAGAALDVLEREPMSPNCPLYGAPNLIITPHVAWAAIETRKRLIDIVSNNLKGWLDGNPINVVI